MTTVSDLILALHDVGESAVLVDLADGPAVRSLTTWVGAHPLRDRLDEVIPGACTLYLSGPLPVLDAIMADTATSRPPDATSSRSRLHQVLVRYDGTDLSEVAERTGLTESDVIDLHSSIEYVVDFFGFAPGQAFLNGVPAALQLPRRPTPRPHVPSGAVAIANEYSVIYPLNSPGGWNLLGTRVSEPLWDDRSEPPNAVEVGDRVAFRAVT